MTRPAEAAYRTAKDIGDTLAKMENAGSPARFVVVPPALAEYGRAVAALRPSLTLRIDATCPPGQLFLMAAIPMNDWPRIS